MQRKQVAIEITKRCGTEGGITFFRKGDRVRGNLIVGGHFQVTSGQWRKYRLVLAPGYFRVL
jgi:hypothetical protein